MMSLAIDAADALLDLRRFVDFALRLEVLLLRWCLEQRQRGERSLARGERSVALLARGAMLVRGTDTDLSRLSSACSKAAPEVASFFSGSSAWADDGVATLGE